MNDQGVGGYSGAVFISVRVFWLIFNGFLLQSLMFRGQSLNEEDEMAYPVRKDPRIQNGGIL